MMDYMVTQSDIENEILRLSSLLEEQTREYGRVLEEQAQAEAAYRISYATVFTSLRMGPEKLSEETCKQKATEDCREALSRRLAADAKARYLEEQCRSLRAQLDAVRTLSANVRAQT